MDTRQIDYGPVAFDRTQVLTFNYVYDLPNVSRSNFLNNAVARTVLNGWQFSGLTSMSVGAPLNATYSVSGVPPLTLNWEITGSEDGVPAGCLHVQSEPIDGKPQHQ